MTQCGIHGSMEYVKQLEEQNAALRAEVDGPFGYKATIKKLTLSVYEWEQGQMGLEKDNAALRSRLALLEKVAVDFDEAMRGDYHRDGIKIRIVLTQDSLNKFRAALDALKEG